MGLFHKSNSFTLYSGDCLRVLPLLDQVDAVVCDPPYGLTQNKKGGSGKASLNLNSPAGRSRITTGGGFMGQKWDGCVPGVEFWEKISEAMKPGAHLLAFGGTRTFHRLTCAIEDAGFEIRDCLMWVYGTGFPKSLNVSKAIDKAAGAEREVVGQADRKNGPGRHMAALSGKKNSESVTPDITAPSTEAAKQWEGWGTALKPAWEPIILARKPLIGTVAANVLEHGTGALNINGCRVGTEARINGPSSPTSASRKSRVVAGYRHDEGVGPGSPGGEVSGRWPANLIHDGCEDATKLFLESGPSRSGGKAGWQKGGYVGGKYEAIERTGYNDKGGSAARFFYCAKASKSERGEGNTHPTVKPLALMRYLCRLVTPPSGVILDPFMGSGSTLIAAQQEGFTSVGIDLDENYCQIALNRLVRDRWPVLK